ncbi:MAG: site-2 protease family protein [Clostridia bacterium]|nr:site-2 protease family protein [Clostridia bacterium]
MNEDIKIYIFAALAALVALTVHEFSHGYAAYKMGDNTARNLGRLTFNPIKHLDPIGLLCMIFFRVGWAKPVPINARNFRNPKWGFALVGVAGPLSNILLGFLTGGVYLTLIALTRGLVVESEVVYNLLSNGLLFLGTFFSVNIGLGIFNLLPIPPFDGSRLLNVILPPKLYFGVMKYERKIYLGVLLWLLLGDTVAHLLRSIPLVASVPWLNFAVGIFSLSGIISTAISAVMNLILDFWQLIPFLSLT